MALPVCGDCCSRVTMALAAGMTALTVTTISVVCYRCDNGSACYDGFARIFLCMTALPATTAFPVATALQFAIALPVMTCISACYDSFACYDGPSVALPFIKALQPVPMAQGWQCLLQCLL